MARTFSGHRLRQARKASGVRYEHLAVAVGRSTDTLRSYEAGRVDPPASVVARLADALDVDPGELFEVASNKAAA
jgi:transcriptional regulator with XRE-family HTH domain